jgi:ABC-type sugar transport system permease subunit
MIEIYGTDLRFIIMIKNILSGSVFRGKAKQEKTEVHKRRRSELFTSYVMIIPLLLLLGGLILYPVVWNIGISLRSEDGIATINNYKVILEDPIFIKVVKNTTI